jgi:DNA-binding NarL/FixJ family response regulator
MSIAMSATTTVAGRARAPKLLFVGRQDLHTEVLAQFLSSALYTTHRFLQQPKDCEAAKADALILIDAKYHDHEALSNKLESLHESDPTIRAVLLNVSSSCAVEKLIHWPCIRGLFFDDCNQELLLKGMQAVLRGELWIPRQLVEQSFERQRQSMRPRPRSNAELSRRERDILRCIARAYSNADIASKLHISEHTVKSHIYNIFRKIGVRNRTEASHWAMSHLVA